MTKPSLLVLAAGIGSRYGGFKQIDPIGPDREIIIDYSLFDALRAGFGKVVVVTVPELEEPIRTHFSRTLGDGLELVFAFQSLTDLPGGYRLPEGRTKPWGTGQAIWAAREVLKEPFGVINADDFYGASSYRVLAEALAGATAPGDYCMVGFELAKTLSEHGTVSRGICQVDAAGNHVEVVEHTTIEPEAGGARSKDADGQWYPLPADAVASMNLWGFNPSIFPHLESQFCHFLASHGEEMKAEFFIPTVVDTLLKKKEATCRVLRTGEQWFGMTYKEDRELASAAVRQRIAAGEYPASLRATRA